MRVRVRVRVRVGVRVRVSVRGKVFIPRMIFCRRIAAYMTWQEEGRCQRQDKDGDND